MQAGLGHAFNSVNPANNDVIWQANTATAEQVDSAVNAARQAFIVGRINHLQNV